MHHHLFGLEYTRSWGRLRELQALALGPTTFVTEQSTYSYQPGGPHCICT